VSEREEPFHVKEFDEFDENTAEKDQKRSQMKTRVVFGTGIGIFIGGAVLAGGWWFTACIASVVLIATTEYFKLVRSDGIADGMTPPPRTVSRACSIICAAMPLMTLYVLLSFYLMHET
jgi:phosphatidate cytidylyltransferase